MLRSPNMLRAIARPLRASSVVLPRSASVPLLTRSIRIKSSSQPTSLPSDAAPSMTSPPPTPPPRAATSSQSASSAPTEPAPTGTPEPAPPPPSSSSASADEPASMTSAPPAPPSSTDPTPSSSSSNATSSVDPLLPPATEPEPEEVIPDKPDLSSLPSLDLDAEALPAPASPDDKDSKGKATGAKSTKAKPGMSKAEKTFWQVLGLGLVGGVVYGGLPFSDEERAQLGEKAGPAQSTFWESPWSSDRLLWRMRVKDIVNYVSDPIWEELLPPPIPPVRPFTLLVDLDGILTCSKWDKTHGWRTAKRPGADYFIAYLSQFYEIVLFTAQPAMNAAPLAEKLDPYAAYMPYRLYRDATRLDITTNTTIKDLSSLNRDLSKVVMLDTDKSHATNQPDNALILPKWTGEPGDQGLVAIIPFLESIGIYKPTDVRPILSAYADKDVAAEFAKIESTRKAQEYATWAATPAGKRALAKADKASSASSSGGWGLPSMSSLLGAPAQPSLATLPKPTAPGPPPSYVDMKRAEAQAMYLEEQKYWKANEGEIKRLMEEDRERQIKEMGGGTVLGMFGAMAGAGAPPKEDK